MQNTSSFRENFSIDYNPFENVYADCFKLLLEQDASRPKAARCLQQYEILADIIENCINPKECNNTLIIKAMELFEIILDQDLICFNINFILKFISSTKFSMQELEEILGHLEYFLERFNRNMKPKPEKITKRLDQLISLIKLCIKNYERYISKENNNNHDGTNQENKQDDENMSDIDSEIE